MGKFSFLWNISQAKVRFEIYNFTLENFLISPIRSAFKKHYLESS